jgi:hypothetical protein
MKPIYLCTTLLFVVSLCFLFNLAANGQGLLTAQSQDLRADSKNGNVGLTWKTASEENLLQFEIEYSEDGRYYHNLGLIPARNSVNGDVYQFEHAVTYTDSAFYRLKIVDNNRRWMYTTPVLYHVNNRTAFMIYPSVITTHVLSLFLKDPFNFLEVATMSGEIILKQNLSGKTGRINVPLSSNLSPGTYIVKLRDYNRSFIQKIVIQ